MGGGGIARTKHRNITERRGRGNVRTIQRLELQQQVGWVESDSEGPKLSTLKEHLLLEAVRSQEAGEGHTVWGHSWERASSLEKSLGC